MKQQKTKTRTKRTEYADYLNTERWKTIREMAYARAGFKCQVCGRSDLPLHTHHNTYVHRGEEEKHLEDLVCLCSDCHALFHGKKNDEEKEQLKQENNELRNRAEQGEQWALYYKDKTENADKLLNLISDKNCHLSEQLEEADDASIYFLTRWRECYDMLQKVCGDNLSEFVETPYSHTPPYFHREEENVTTYPF